MRSCPICGETKLYMFYSGWSKEDGQIEPEEGWCDFCGFGYQQYTPNPNADMQKAMDDHLWAIVCRIDNIDDEISDAQKFKAQIPELNKRIKWDELRKELGWEKLKEGGWVKKG